MPSPRGCLSPGSAVAIFASSFLKPRPEEAWDVEARRRKNDADMAITGGGRKKDVSALDFSIPSAAGELGLRLYRKPGRSNDALIVYYHGGGWVIGGLEANDSIARGLCHFSGAAVLSVAYRLAPEAPFPAAVEDATRAYEWVLENAVERGWNASRVFVSGDSAGANLAAVVCLVAKDKGLAQPRGQILFYPVADIGRMDTFSYDSYREGYLLTKADMEWFADLYCPPARRGDYRVSPLLAADFTGLAPALVVTAEFDVLRDEGEAYAARLAEAGVPVERLRARGVTHAFVSMARFNPVAARRAFLAAAEFVEASGA